MANMKTTKNAYLEKLTKQIQMKSVKVGKNLEGSTPPSVFIGRWSYPKVYAGPMMANQLGDTAIMDSPESWIGEHKNQEDIIKYRMSLVRGKQLIKIDDLDNPFVEKLQDISLASKAIDSEATFGKRPTGALLTEDSMPHGPSAVIEKFDIDAVRWDKQLEKTYYDTDLKASEAVLNLHNKEVPFTAMQKAFSVGAFGTKNKRKLVPTRWSITACDTTLADQFLKEVRKFEKIDTYRVYEFGSLNNYYVIILTPTEWQYEWYEAFIKIIGKEEIIFRKIKKEFSACRKSILKIPGHCRSGIPQMLPAAQFPLRFRAMCLAICSVQTSFPTLTGDAIPMRCVRMNSWTGSTGPYFLRRCFSRGNPFSWCLRGLIRLRKLF